MTISAGTIDLPFAGGFDLELPGEHAAGLLSHLRAFGDQAGLPRDSLRLLLKTLDYAAEMEQTIADQSARIVELEALAATDALTGLHNRRGFAEALRHTLKLAARHDETGILIYIDLDGFKGVNDAHGHDAGDSLLCRVAEVVSLHLRGSDIVARIGGDEFAAVLTRADPIEGATRAQALRRALNTTYLPWHGENIPIRASLGMETFDADADIDADSLLRRADLAMYRDKRARRAAAC